MCFRASFSRFKEFYSYVLMVFQTIFPNLVIHFYEKKSAFSLRRLSSLRNKPAAARVCNLFHKSKSIISTMKKSRIFRFIATCKSVIRNIKSILAINALLICQRLPGFPGFSFFFDIGTINHSFSSLIHA